MRITVDTNILISATFWIGNPHKIIKMAEDKKFDLVLSTTILSEFEEIMKQDKFQLKLDNLNTTINEVVSKFISISEIIKTSGKLHVVKEDPEDNKILECAVEGKVDYIVSGDNHLLKLGEYEGIKIITASKMLEILGGRGRKDFK